MGWRQLHRYLFQVLYPSLPLACCLVHAQGLASIRSNNARSLLLRKYLESFWSCLRINLSSRAQISRVGVSGKGGVLRSSVLPVFVSSTYLTSTLARIVWAHSRSMLRLTGTRLSMPYQTIFLLVSLPLRSCRVSQLSHN